MIIKIEAIINFLIKSQHMIKKYVVIFLVIKTQDVDKYTTI